MNSDFRNDMLDLIEYAEDHTKRAKQCDEAMTMLESLINARNRIDQAIQFLEAI